MMINKIKDIIIPGNQKRRNDLIIDLNKFL